MRDTRWEEAREAREEERRDAIEARESNELREPDGTTECPTCGEADPYQCECEED